jgi:hypothetical protein
VIIASKNSQSAAESVATEAQGKGLTVGILKSDDYSNLNPGYQVVFTEKFDSKSAAEDTLSDVQKNYPDAYVRKVESSTAPAARARLKRGGCSSTGGRRGVASSISTGISAAIECASAPRS